MPPRMQRSVAAKLERRRIAQRTARGRADAKTKGVRFGRKPKLTGHQRREALERIEAGETQRSVVGSYNVRLGDADKSRASGLVIYPDLDGLGREMKQLWDERK
jgi:hypothetical protein